MLAKLHKMLKPRLGLRIVKTLISVLIVAVVYRYVLDNRNPCFACIGAVFGMGSIFQEGMKHGGNRFIGTLLGGLVVIPFYWLYYTTPFGIPAEVFLIVGLFCVIYINLVFGTGSAIQPGTVIYFVVMFTVSQDRYISYTIARIIDTGVGVVVSLAINALFLPPQDKKQKELQAQTK